MRFVRKVVNEICKIIQKQIILKLNYKSITR